MGNDLDTGVDYLAEAGASEEILEAARRSIGWILPVTAVGFLLYAWAGPFFDTIGLPLLAHRGYPPDRLIGTLYITLEGLFGIPLDVAGLGVTPYVIEAGISP